MKTQTGMFFDPDPEPEPEPRPTIKKPEELWSGGGERYRLAREKGIVDRAVSLPGDPEWTDMMAAKAEHLAAKACHATFHKQLGTPGPHEFRLPDGRKVDVKWTPRDGGSLICRYGAIGDAEIYLLVTGSSPEALTIRGWATSQRLHSSVRDLGYGPTYVLRQNELTSGLPI